MVFRLRKCRNGCRIYLYLSNAINSNFFYYKNYPNEIIVIHLTKESKKIEISRLINELFGKTVIHSKYLHLQKKKKKIYKYIYGYIIFIVI